MLSESETINDAVTFCKKVIHPHFHDLDFHNFERDFGSGRSTIIIQLKCTRETTFYPPLAVTAAFHVLGACIRV